MRNSPSAPPRPWPLRVIGFLVFGVVFVRELVLANIAVAKSVLFQPLHRLSPGFVRYSIKGLSEFEVLVLSHCITLTPGTTSVEVSENRDTLVVHALDSSNPDAVCTGIKKTLEAPIMAWTR